MDEQSAAVTRAFAQLLHEEMDATKVLLFGSQVTGKTHRDSDYDFIIVSPRFEGTPAIGRSVGLRSFWRRAGGDAPVDLFCLTPEEFERARGRINLLSAVLP